MISVTAAKKLISNNTKTLNPTRISLENACGHILAADLIAKYNIPQFMQSSMDGYAFRFGDKVDSLRLVGEMAAGTNNKMVVHAGDTSRIFTGAPLPEGADTVVMQEKIRVEGDLIILQDDKLKIGSNVRQIGAEICAGDLAMKAGALLNPAAIGFLAGLGVAEVDVFPMPKVAIVITGNELKKPGEELDFGQVYESNSYSLSAALATEGIDQVSILHAIDDLKALTNKLNEALLHSDIVLLTGGVSVGDYDFVVDASASCGVQQIFHKIKQKPGKPLYFGKKGKKLIFGLPGNPSSVLSCYYNYVLPALKQLSGKVNSTQEITAKLSASCSKPAGLTHFLKGFYETGIVTPLTAQESFRLSSFAQANCLIILEEEETHLRAGQIVNVILLPLP